LLVRVVEEQRQQQQMQVAQTLLQTAALVPIHTMEQHLRLGLQQLLLAHQATLQVAVAVVLKVGLRAMAVLEAVAMEGRQTVMVSQLMLTLGLVVAAVQMAL
jgi:hypothetical protein